MWAPKSRGMRGIKEKRATRSDGAVNKCTLGVNKVTSCLYRAVMHSTASPKAPTSLGIVWTWGTGSMVGVVYTQYTVGWQWEKNCQVATKITQESPMTPCIERSYTMLYHSLEYFRGQKRWGYLLK